MHVDRLGTHMPCSVWGTDTRYGLSWTLAHSNRYGL
jgi:hypothetical protein